MVQINKFVSLFSNMNYQSQSEDYKTEVSLNKQLGPVGLQMLHLFSANMQE